jgi:hypothetical protein
MVKTRTTQQIDLELKKLRAAVLDSRRDSDRWKLAWEKIDKILEERFALTVVDSRGK